MVAIREYDTSELLIPEDMVAEYKNSEPSSNEYQKLSNDSSERAAYAIYLFALIRLRMAVGQKGPLFKNETMVPLPLPDHVHQSLLIIANICPAVITSINQQILEAMTHEGVDITKLSDYVSKLLYHFIGRVWRDEENRTNKTFGLADAQNISKSIGHAVTAQAQQFKQYNQVKVSYLPVDIYPGNKQKAKTIIMAAV